MDEQEIESQNYAFGTIPICQIAGKDLYGGMRKYNIT